MNYLVCLLDETVWGKTMALRVNEEINSRLRFLHRNKSIFICYLLCNALIQPHNDYACTVWFPNLTKKLKEQLQVT